MTNRHTRFETLVMQHLDAAYNLARWLSRSPVDAEDIVQDAMLKAFRGFDGLRGEAVRPWLMAIVRRCVFDHAASSRRHGGGMTVDWDDQAFDGPTPEAEAAKASDRRRLDRLLAQLPDDYREVLVLREIEDLSYRQIADAIGAPIGTVMSRLARARAQLKTHWLAEEVR